MTALSPFLPIAGTAAAALARQAARAIGGSLSFAAELMQQGGQPPAPTADSNRTAARDQLASALSQFAKRLKQHLEMAGLSLSAPIELAADGLGGIDVADNHPQQAAIEQVLAAEDSLRQQFALLADLNEQIDVAGSRHEFALLIDGDEAEVIAGKH